MKLHKNQSGFALLILVVVLLSIAGVIGSNLIQGRAKTSQLAKMQHDQNILLEAKKALLSYAVQYKRGNDLYEMGRLPCPDYLVSNPEGTQDGNCGAMHTNQSGFLPWKELGIDALKDSSGECLWYVVSGDYKNSPKAYMLNEDSNGLLQVQDENGELYHGDKPGDRPIALIIAPGPALNGQDRTPSDNTFTHCRGRYGDENQYLESGGLITYSTDHVYTADTIWTYLYSSMANRLENNNYNDQIVWISKSEYWDAVKAQGDLDAADTGKEINKLTKALAQCVDLYASDSENNNHWLPWPAAIDLADYRKNSEYIDQNNPTSLMGRFPGNLTNTNSKETGGQSSNMTNFLNSCLSADELNLWENWKDHFFYVVSEGFEMVHGENDSNFEDRCSSDKCVKIDGSSDKYAGVIFYADSIVDPQSRNYPPVDADEKKEISNYLNTDGSQSNAHLYPSDLSYSGDDKKYFRNIGDLMYCIRANSHSFSVTECH